MHPAIQHEIASRLVSHLRAGTQDRAPELMEFPISRYRDTKWAEREREVLRRLPLAVAHGSEIPEPGNHLTDTFIGVPISSCGRRAARCGPS